MKNATLVLVLGLLTGLFELQAQHDSTVQFDAWITPINSKLARQGYLYQLKDSSVLLSNVSNFSSKKMQLKEYKIDQVKLIKVRKRNKTLKNAALGALVGFGIGVVAGFADDDDPESDILPLKAKDKAMILGTLFIPPGALIGGMIGNVYTQFPINGSFDTYQKQKEKLARYSRY